METQIQFLYLSPKHLSFSPGDPSMELSVVSSEDKTSLAPQKLLCSGSGFYPKITWLSPSRSEINASSKVTLEADGRVKVTSELLVSQQKWTTGGEFTCKVGDQTHTSPIQRTTSVCAGILMTYYISEMLIIFI